MLAWTGDLHGDLFDLRSRVENVGFFKEDGLDVEEDCLLVAGDFGFIWFNEDNSLYERQQRQLDEIEELPITIAFVDGNHENFHELFKYPIEKWNDGKVHRIRKNIVHLMRGEIFNIHGKSIFAFGGAPSHDINGLATDEELRKNYAAGVVDPGDSETIFKLRNEGLFYRTKGIGWWKEEMPTPAEMAHALENLDVHDNKVDIIITHEAPIQDLHRVSKYAIDPGADCHKLSEFLGKIKNKVDYEHWFFGHYHMNCQIDNADEVGYWSVHII